MEHILAKDLRDAVLQHAFKGMLTEQYSSDTNIEEYYDELIKNKAKNVELKKWKKEVPVEKIDNSDFEYDLRNNWKWVYFGEIVAIRGGKRVPAGRTLSNEKTSQKYIRVSDMKNHSVNIENIKYLPEDLIEKLQQYRISKDDIYITVAGTIGDVGEIPEDLDDANLTENANKIVFENINKKWLILCLLSNCIQKQIIEATTKVGQPKLAIRRIQSLSIPLCPLEEQQRIVDKVDELMAKIDEYEKIENQLVQLKEEFPGDMKDAILQAAMQGKLTKQLSSDSSVLEYIENITKVKEELLKSKQIKKDKTTENDDEEYPFDIPENWSWIKFGSLATLRPGKTPPRAEPVWWGKENEVPWVSIADMIPNGKISKTKEYISKKGFEDKFHGVISPKGTLIMSFKLTIGRVSILDIDALHNEAIISILPFKDENGTLQKYLMKVLPYLTKYGDSKNAIKGDTLNADSLCNLYIPLPPIEEQQRIVDLLDKVLPLCDSLQS